VIVPGTPGKDGATGPQGVQGLKGDKGDPAMVDFSKIPIPILDCLEPGSAKIVEDVVDVISGALGSEAKLIGLLFNEILRIRQAQCDEEPSVDTPSVIASGTSLEGDQVSVVPITNQDSRLFALVLKPPFPNSVRLYQLGGATQTEGNFGTASLAYQVGTTSYTAVHGSPLNVATPATLIAVPNLPLQAYIRISLKVGVSWELWDMGLRQAQPSLPAA
jgi:hypothetical protein